MRVLLFCLLLFASIATKAQVFSGKVLDASNRTSIGYVNIGVVNHDIGTVSDEDGKFSLSLSQLGNNDTLKFSCIGYKDVILYGKERSKWENMTEINMKPQALTLDAVVIKPVTYKPIMIGHVYKKQTLKMQAGYENNDLGSEVGNVMSYHKKGTIVLKKLHFYITQNAYETVKFRVNIYEVQKGKPTTSLLQTPLYATFDQKNGELIVDVSDRNISFEKDIFVSLEWIKDLGKKGLWFQAAFGDDSISRKTSQGKWKRIGLNLSFWAEALYCPKQS